MKRRSPFPQKSTAGEGIFVSCVASGREYKGGRMKKIVLLLIINCFMLCNAYSTPRQIVLLRHADKLPQYLTGPAVSAKGYIRALKFSFYFLSYFGEPDFVVAGKPKGKDASIRELQTVGPLVNILAERHPDIGFDILHPYTHEEYDELAKYILKDKKFDNKLVLICWRHTKIVELVKALGVKNKLEPWPDDDYDSVYILDYDQFGTITKFTILHNQYPMNNAVTWENIYQYVQYL